MSMERLDDNNMDLYKIRCFHLHHLRHRLQAPNDNVSPYGCSDDAHDENGYDELHDELEIVRQLPIQVEDHKRECIKTLYANDRIKPMITATRTMLVYNIIPITATTIATAIMRVTSTSRTLSIFISPKLGE